MQRIRQPVDDCSHLGAATAVVGGLLYPGRNRPVVFQAAQHLLDPFPFAPASVLRVWLEIGDPLEGDLADLVAAADQRDRGVLDPGDGGPSVAVAGGPPPGVVAVHVNRGRVPLPPEQLAPDPLVSLLLLCRPCLERLRRVVGRAVVGRHEIRRQVQAGAVQIGLA